MTKRGITIKELQNENEAEEKRFRIIKKIGYIITIAECVFIVFMLPFVYTIFANALINMKIVESFEQIEQANNIFRSFNILIIIAFSILILYESDVSVSEIIQKITSNLDISFKKGDNEVIVKQHEVEYYKNNIRKMAQEVKEEAHDEIIKEEISNSEKNCEECKIDEITEERDNLRYFASFQVTNKYSRSLLKFIKNNDKIDIEIFKEQLISYYNKTIKNMGKKRKQDYIIKKVEEILYNLKYLNIIEYTEDDKYIILTQNSIEFVKSYEEVG